MVFKHAKESGIPYALPIALEAVTAILMEYVSSGKRLYSDKPWTYTRCQEKVNANKWPVVIGGFAADGPGSIYDCSGSYDFLGAGVARRV